MVKIVSKIGRKGMTPNQQYMYVCGLKKRREGLGLYFPRVPKVPTGQPHTRGKHSEQRLTLFYRLPRALDTLNLSWPELGKVYEVAEVINLENDAGVMQRKIAHDLKASVNLDENYLDDFVQPYRYEEYNGGECFWAYFTPFSPMLHKGEVIWTGSMTAADSRKNLDKARKYGFEGCLAGVEVIQAMKYYPDWVDDWDYGESEESYPYPILGALDYFDFTKRKYILRKQTLDICKEIHRDGKRVINLASANAGGVPGACCTPTLIRLPAKEDKQKEKGGIRPSTYHQRSK